MLENNEDDTKGFRIIAKIYEFLVLHFGISYHEFNMRWKSANAVKKALADKVNFFRYLMIFVYLSILFISF